MRGDRSRPSAGLLPAPPSRRAVRFVDPPSANTDPPLVFLSSVALVPALRLPGFARIRRRRRWNEEANVPLDGKVDVLATMPGEERFDVERDERLRPDRTPAGEGRPRPGATSGRFPYRDGEPGPASASNGSTAGMPSGRTGTPGYCVDCRPGVRCVPGSDERRRRTSRAAQPPPQDGGA